jgi:hypothetical protein
MKQDRHSTSALGVPGQLEGLATLQSDRGDETQSFFMYQWAAGVVALAGSLASQNSYVAVWCEHHDDLLAELSSGGFHAIQVKSNSAQGAAWKCSDSGFIDAVRKFAQHESQYSSQVEQYVFFSNAKPYIPSGTAKKSGRQASSPFRLRDQCRIATDANGIPSPYKDSFDALVTATGSAAELLFRVLRKLEFQKGPPLEGFRDHLTQVVAGIPACTQLTMERLCKVRDEIFFLIGTASSLSIPSLDFYTSILQSDGRPAAAIRSKRVSVEEFEGILKQDPSAGFLYADVGGLLQLGQASGQMEVLRKKMNAGYVGAYFYSVWLQAMAAEQRLLERALIAPEAALQTIRQLESVVLVECQNAEALAALESDERRKGLLIYQRIIQRTGELASHDRASVVNERAETLRGVAGLLSGSCKFAWGVPIIEGDGDGT